ncbi:hypothetical protein BH09ACT8_BH09ACT8_43970 [soil metagenome]
MSLPDGAVVGYEALARWPSHDDANPQAMFAQARANGGLDRLDRWCTDSAITSALDARLGREAALFINCEPATSYVARVDNAVLDRGAVELQLIFELTERGLLQHPHKLLEKVAALRSDGFAIALDDVGANPDSLALLDVVAPDVIKLDFALVQSQPDHEQARTLAAVLAHHERTGTTILAEGIETDVHLEQALALGAQLGQGFRFGRPGPLNLAPPTGKWAPTVGKSRERSTAESPFELVSDHAAVRTARKETLIAFSHLIETQASRASDPPMVLAALQRAQYLTEDTQRRYADLAGSIPLIALFGEELPPDLAPGIRGVPLRPADPLCAEWIVLTLGPHTAAALIARECPGLHDARDNDRRFDFVMTYDRALVTLAAYNLLDRMT